MFTMDLLSVLVILAVTLLGGAYPFAKKKQALGHVDFPVGAAMASGVFLGAGLLHLLADSSRQFAALAWHYPLASLLAGGIFLFLLLFEHVGREINEHEQDSSATFALVAAGMLSVHGFLEGAALGLNQSISVVLVLLMAILAHKWVASFALAVQINKSQLSYRTGVMVFVLFALTTPLGIILGHVSTRYFTAYPLIEPIFTALAAGTFIYLGTLHGLKRAVLVDSCCDLRHFRWVVLGFGLMAVLALWV